MPELVVVVPSRGRPHAVSELAGSFHKTCTADTLLIFAVDESDPTRESYRQAVRDLGTAVVERRVVPSTTMVEALNLVVGDIVEWADLPDAIGFMGDDHRPRTRGWDRTYLDVLADGPGIVYGDDLFQHANLPTQCAISAGVARAWGHMAPSVLEHMEVDTYWREVGRAAGIITYLPDVVVEHMHPYAKKSEWDEHYLRVNDNAVYTKDRKAIAAYWAEHGQRDIQAALSATVVSR